MYTLGLLVDTDHWAGAFQLAIRSGACEIRCGDCTVVSPEKKPIRWGRRGSKSPNIQGEIHGTDDAINHFETQKALTNRRDIASRA